MHDTLYFEITYNNIYGFSQHAVSRVPFSVSGATPWSALTFSIHKMSNRDLKSHIRIH